MLAYVSVISGRGYIDKGKKKVICRRKEGRDDERETKKEK
jgi:hypothetical protein